MLFFRYCQVIFRQNGISLDFPEGTKPENTYKWRYLESFAKKVIEWGINDVTACRIIEAVVMDSSRDDLRRKGLAILTKSKILEIGYAALKTEEANYEQAYNRLVGDCKFVDTRGSERYITLANRDKNNVLPNIVKWYIQGYLSTLFLATSKAAIKVMATLSDSDRKMLPSREQLFATRNRYLNNALRKSKIRLLLGEDWHKND